MPRSVLFKRARTSWTAASDLDLLHERRLQVSPVIGFMLVGMAVGPFGFGFLTAHFAWLTAVTIDAPKQGR